MGLLDTHEAHEYDDDPNEDEYTSHEYDIVEADGIHQVRIAHSAVGWYKPVYTCYSLEEAEEWLYENWDTVIPAEMVN